MRRAAPCLGTDFRPCAIKNNARLPGVIIQMVAAVRCFRFSKPGIYERSHSGGQSIMEFQLDHAREILGRTPATLNALLSRLPDEWVVPNEGPGSWSPFDVVGHLIHGEEADWIPRAKIILRYGEARAFEPFDRFAMFEASRGKSLDELLATFERRRGDSLRESEAMNLTPELLARRGMHPELGAVTLAQLLSTWVVHDLGHVGQVSRVMAKQYGEAVGAWRAYLPVLSR